MCTGNLDSSRRPFTWPSTSSTSTWARRRFRRTSSISWECPLSWLPPSTRRSTLQSWGTLLLYLRTNSQRRWCWTWKKIFCWLSTSEWPLQAPTGSSKDSKGSQFRWAITRYFSTLNTSTRLHFLMPVSLDSSLLNWLPPPWSSLRDNWRR